MIRRQFGVRTGFDRIDRLAADSGAPRKVRRADGSAAPYGGEQILDARPHRFPAILSPLPVAAISLQDRLNANGL
jgi:hypothetical protein